VVEFLSALQGQMGVKASCLDHYLVRCAHYARRRRGEPISVHDRLIFFSPDLLQIIPAIFIDLESSWWQHQRVPTGTFGT
jgi:hypothetical protein